MVVTSLLAFTSNIIICTMPLTRLCLQCSASANVKKAKCVCGHTICKRRSIGTKERKIAMKRKRQLEPEGTMSMRRGVID